MFKTKDNYGNRRLRVTAVTAAALSMLTLLPQAAFAATSGAIFTTNVACNGTNVNIFGSKDVVYLDGGPAHTGAAGLPDGFYYVKVTEPNGAVLGTSVPNAPVAVVGGEFVNCYQLSAIVTKTSDASPGYDDTTNPGREYKVWVSQDSSFPESSSKTDNFKVNSTCPIGDPACTPGEPPSATLNVTKFYDANANGVNDSGDQPIANWQVRIQDGIDFVRYTPVTIIVEPDTYTVTESQPLETNWLPTTANPVSITLANHDVGSVAFGNLCLGAGGGLTLGFWSNKNGQALFGADDLALMVSLNLRNANGSVFDPVSYAAFRSWLLSANASNMAYMLSAQLAAMELNVLNGKVNGGALIYAPNTGVGNALGFATVNAVMTAANNALADPNGNTTAAGPARTLQEALKNALDKANNNLNFVQATPCPFSFTTS